MLALVAGRAAAISLASVSPFQLRALTSIAAIRTECASLPPTAALPEQSTFELRATAASLIGELDALACQRNASTLLGLHAAPPRLEASLLEERLLEEAEELSKVQEQQDEDRSRQLFDLIGG